jgi:hypothetical protein
MKRLSDRKKLSLTLPSGDVSIGGDETRKLDLAESCK